MEYKIVCKYVEMTFVSWNNMCPIQMLYDIVNNIKYV